MADPLAEGAHLLAGAVRMDMRTKKVYNSAVFIDHLGNNVGNYDKVHLVPFGEYIPFRSILPFQSIASDVGDFDVGAPPRAFNINGLRIAMAVCYEAIFPVDFFPKNQEVDVIINLTNDAWFGTTTEPFQHLQIVQARAVETGLPLIRATNFGISAMFDHCGRELNRVGINHVGVFDAYVPKKCINATPYSAYGDVIFWTIIALLTLAAFIIEWANLRRLSFR